MRPLSLLLLTALAFAAPARAESIGFAYSWTVLPGPVFPGGTGSVVFAATPDGTSSSELGSAAPTFIPGVDLSTTSSAVDTPDSFSSPFSLKLTLTDTLSGASGEFLFSGSLAGELTLTTSTLTATFDGLVTKSLTLGGHLYSVGIDPTLANVPVPGSAAMASIAARITVTDSDPAPGGEPPVPTDAPEPGTLVLAATAAAGFLARWRASRRPAA